MWIWRLIERFSALLYRIYSFNSTRRHDLRRISFVQRNSFKSTWKETLWSFTDSFIGLYWQYVLLFIFGNHLHDLIYPVIDFLLHREMFLAVLNHVLTASSDCLRPIGLVRLQILVRIIYIWYRLVFPWIPLRLHRRLEIVSLFINLLLNVFSFSKLVVHSF